VNVKVKVLANRRCFASIEADFDLHKDVYVMSFGDKQRPDTDVEIEFTAEQLKKLRDLLNEMYGEDEFEHKHFGEC